MSVTVILQLLSCPLHLPLASCLLLSSLGNYLDHTFLLHVWIPACLHVPACKPQFLTAIIPPALLGYICVLPYWWHILQICFWIIIFWSLPQHINKKSSSTVVSGMSLLSVTVIKTLQYERMSCCAVNLTTHHQHFITSQHYIDISVHWLYRCQVKSPHPEVLSSFLWHHVATVMDYFMLA